MDRAGQKFNLVRFLSMNFPTMRVENKIAVVTGKGSGLGRAIAIGSRIPRGRLGKPEDIVGSVVYLSSARDSARKLIREPPRPLSDFESTGINIRQALFLPQRNHRIHARRAMGWDECGNAADSEQQRGN